MRKQILQHEKKKDKQKAKLKKVIIIIVVLSMVTFFCGLFISLFLNRNVNSEFETYAESVTMTDENFEQEIECLSAYLDNLTLSNLNKGYACNLLSIMYGLKNQRYENILYMCKAIYYYHKENANAAMIQMSVNLSATLISDTSYDMAESILENALDAKITKEEEIVYHIYIYTNLAESMSQRGNYDQALEAIQLAESKLDKVKQEYFADCLLSLKISKALAYHGLGDVEKSKKLLNEIDDESLKNNILNAVTYAIPYYEALSYVMLSEGKLEEAQECFEHFLEYCDKYMYTLLKLRYIDKFTKIAQSHGYEDTDFVKKYHDGLLDLYREEITRVNDESAKILLDSYNINAENVKIQSRARMNQLKIYGGVAVFFIILTVILVMSIEIRKKSQIDFLTGTYNRAKLRSVYRALMKRKQKFYIIMFDIDNFKMCNDIYGHRFGDVVLEQISHNISDELPRTSMFFRYGGEEFVVLCELKNKTEVMDLAERIRRCVDELVWENGTHISISVGVSSSVNTADPLKSADECLYTSKETGKNKVTYDFEI